MLILGVFNGATVEIAIDAPLVYYARSSQRLKRTTDALHSSGLIEEKRSFYLPMRSTVSTFSTAKRSERTQKTQKPLIYAIATCLGPLLLIYE
jgi:hypothetical protein